MTETMKSAVQSAVLKLLEPLVRLLLAAGMGVGDLMALVKVAYVRAARDQGQERGEVRPNASRIAVVTGLTRAEVAAMLAADLDEHRTSDRGRHRAERVLSGWWNDSDFHTPQGEPAHLALSGARRSFKALVARYSNEPRVAPILDELLRVNAVRRRSDGTYQALSRSYATVRWDAQGIEAAGEQLKEHCETLLHNLEHPARPRLVRRVVNAQLDPRYLAVLMRSIDEHVNTLADSLDDSLNARSRTVAPVPEGRDAIRLGVTMYIFEEPVVLETPTSPPGEELGRAAARPQTRRKK